MLQEPMTQPTAKTTQSIAVLEHLSGPSVGTRTILSGASIAIHVDDDRRLRAVEPGDIGDAAADPVATLARGERTYHLQAENGHSVWVNGRQVGSAELVHKDIGRVRREGPALPVSAHRQFNPFQALLLRYLR